MPVCPQYRDALRPKAEPANQTIDLKMGASAREARDTDRRFGKFPQHHRQDRFLVLSAASPLIAAFEVVTPALGKRVYQATSKTEMQVRAFVVLLDG
jgi:hypothetical protein